MDLRRSPRLKRQCVQDPREASDMPKVSPNAEQSNDVARPSEGTAAAPSSSSDGGSVNSLGITAKASVLAACHAALVSSPAESRAALSKHKLSIDPALSKALEIVGGYDVEVGNSLAPLSRLSVFYLLFAAFQFM